MDKLVELFKESVIMQSLLALMFGGTVCYMYLTQQPVPGELLALLGAIVGFYFGAKVGVEARKTANYIGRG